MLLWALSNCARGNYCLVVTQPNHCSEFCKPKCPMPNYQLPMPKTTFIESAIYPPGDIYSSLPSCLYFFCFTWKRKSPLSPRSGQIQISFREIPRNEKYNCTMEQFFFERYHHWFSTGLKVTLTNNLCIVWPRFRGEAVTKIYKGPSRRLLTDP